MLMRCTALLRGRRRGGRGGPGRRPGHDGGQPAFAGQALLEAAARGRIAYARGQLLQVGARAAAGRLGLGGPQLVAHPASQVRRARGHQGEIALAQDLRHARPGRQAFEKSLERTLETGDQRGFAGLLHVA